LFRGSGGSQTFARPLTVRRISALVLSCLVTASSSESVDLVEETAGSRCPGNGVAPIAEPRNGLSALPRESASPVLRRGRAELGFLRRRAGPGQRTSRWRESAIVYRSATGIRSRWPLDILSRHGYWQIELRALALPRGSGRCRASRVFCVQHRDPVESAYILQRPLHLRAGADDRNSRGHVEILLREGKRSCAPVRYAR